MGERCNGTRTADSHACTRSGALDLPKIASDLPKIAKAPKIGRRPDLPKIASPIFRSNNNNIFRRSKIGRAHESAAKFAHYPVTA